MRIGAVLPSFDPGAERALEQARQAEERGLHGVFAYDHLWPMGEPRRPAIAPFPLLGRVAAEYHRIFVGTFVARIGLVSDEILIREFRTLAAVADGRMIAGIGTGDRKSADENYAFGLGFTRADERRRSLRNVALRLCRDGLEVWIGAGSEETNEVAWSSGVTLNVFDVDAGVLAERATHGPVSWGGLLPRRPAAAAARLREISEAGATWAVVGAEAGRLADAAEAAGIALG